MGRILTSGDTLIGFLGQEIHEQRYRARKVQRHGGMVTRPPALEQSLEGEGGGGGWKPLRNWN